MPFFVVRAPARVAEVLKGVGLSELDVEIVLTLCRVRSYARAAERLKLSAGRVRHRFFRALSLLRERRQEALADSLTTWIP